MYSMHINVLKQIIYNKYIRIKLNKMNNEFTN